MFALNKLVQGEHKSAVPPEFPFRDTRCLYNGRTRRFLLVSETKLRDDFHTIEVRLCTDRRLSVLQGGVYCFPSKPFTVK